ncbi:MAG: photosynthetic reaction center subunit H, partial [Alphaproteobacteria bacterium]
GAPIEPTGNPMRDGVGPASYAERMDEPDMTHHGEVKIVPLRAAHGYSVCAEDPDPRGMPVVACDGKEAGKIVDIWVDQSEHVVRYLEVAAGMRNVLLPITFAIVKSEPRFVYVNAITSEQFADVPGTKSPNQITFLEEDRICGYFGGGTLYATPGRSEPIL